LALQKLCIPNRLENLPGLSIASFASHSQEALAKFG
jgi:hypothetical protein